VAIVVGAPAGNLHEQIDVIPQRKARSTGAEGWVFVGTVHDVIVDQALQVLWNPATDRVRVSWRVGRTGVLLDRGD